MRGVRDRIEKLDAPEGDENSVLCTFMAFPLTSIEKLDAPEGDENNQTAGEVWKSSRIEKLDTQEVDGNFTLSIS